MSRVVGVELGPPGERPGFSLARLGVALADHGWSVTESWDANSIDVLHLWSADVARAWIASMPPTQARVVVGCRWDELGSGVVADPGAYAEVWARADAIHAESDRVRDVLARAGAPAERLVVISPTIEAGVVARPSAGEALRLLSVGPLSWTQGFEHALAAVRALRRRDVACRYRIVGEGEHLDALAFARHQLELGDAVDLPGAAGDLAEELRQADVLVCPAVVAGDPYVTLAAMAAALPIVGTGRSGETGDGAVVVPARNPAALADALARVAGDRSLRASLGAAARARAIAAPGLAQQAARFRALYDPAEARPMGQPCVG